MNNYKPFSANATPNSKANPLKNLRIELARAGFIVKPGSVAGRNVARIIRQGGRNE